MKTDSQRDQRQHWLHRLLDIGNNTVLGLLMATTSLLVMHEIGAQTLGSNYPAVIESSSAGGQARIDVLGERFTPLPAVASSQSRIVLYRLADSRAGATSVFVNDRYHDSLVPGAWSQLCYRTGPVEIATRQMEAATRPAKDRYDAISAVTLQAGQVHYLRVSEANNRPVLRPVPAAQALQEIANTREQLHTVSRVAQDCVDVMQAPAVLAQTYTLPADTLFAFDRSDRAGMTDAGTRAIDMLLSRLQNDYTFTPVGTATVVNGVAYYSTYQMTVTTPGSGSGTLAVSVAAGTYTDTAGNSGNAATATQQYGATIPGGLVPASQVIMDPAVGEYSHSLELSNGNYVWGSGQYGAYGNSNVINGSIRVLDSTGTVVRTISMPSQITTAPSTLVDTGGMDTISFAANPNGFAIAYRLNTNIYLALYDNSGVLQNTSTVATPVVTTLGSATGGNIGGIHALTYSPDTGNYVVAYVASNGIYTQEVLANSTAVGTATRVSDTLTSISAYGGIDISTLANGHLAVSWNQTPGTEGVMTRVLDKQGVPLSGSNVLTSFTSLTAYESLQVESVSAQNFVVVGASTPVNNSSAYGVITAVLYQNNGTLVRTSTVSTENTGTNSHPRMAVLDNGNLVIVYQHTPAAQGAGSDIRFQLFDASLNKIGGEQTVLNTTDKDWTYAGSDATVTATSGGGFVIGVGGSKDPDAGSPGTSTSGAMFFGIDSFQAFYDASGTPVSQSGTAGADNLFGRDGNDILNGAGGADKIYAGAGDDTVVLNADNVTQLGTSGSGALVDGGTGTNLLKLDTSAAANITLDLTNVTVGSQLVNFQKFDITGNGANTLKLNVSDVLASNMVVGAKAHVVQIDGDAGDIVNLNKLFDNGSTTGTWSTSSTSTVGATTYNVYNYSGDASLQVLIDNQITSVTLS